MRITRTFDRRLAFALALLLVAGLIVRHDSWAQSGNHGDGHAEMHHIYKNWHSPANPAVSCCNDADCRPTRAKVDESGHWFAWNGYKWLPVPSRALLPPDAAGDGRSHICEKQEFIYCFTPADPKS